MPNHFKVHELLTAEQLAELEGFAREPGRTVDECWAWLTERGHEISRGAVGNWLADFRRQILVERMNGAGGLARAFMEAAKDSGGLAVPDAAVLQVSQMVFDLAAQASADGEVDPGDLAKMSLSLQRLMLAKARLESVRAEFEERARAAVDAGAKVAMKGGTSGSVVETIKKALGITEAAA